MEKIKKLPRKPHSDANNLELFDMEKHIQEHMKDHEKEYREKCQREYGMFSIFLDVLIKHNFEKNPLCKMQCSTEGPQLNYIEQKAVDDFKKVIESKGYRITHHVQQCDQHLFTYTPKYQLIVCVE